MRQNIKNFARKLRKQSTLSEVLLWRRIRNRQVCGYKFLRQKVLGPFVLDFYCFELKLAIEVDGSSHYENIEYDLRRDKFLSGLGITTLRIPDSMVKNNLQGVVWEIEGAIAGIKK